VPSIIGLIEIFDSFHFRKSSTICNGRSNSLPLLPSASRIGMQSAKIIVGKIDLPHRYAMLETLAVGLR
jgi:hypothetical protein